jgi:hypothetical protein
MSKKKAFALRLNEDMLKAIEKWSTDEFRSVNGQIEWMLMKSLREAKRLPQKKEGKSPSDTGEP